VLPAALTEILVCPKSKQPLIYFEAEGFLLCPASRLQYRIEGDVPVLLIEEARELAAAEVDALVKRAKDLKLPGA
jgi:hypothetical protein